MIQRLFLISMFLGTSLLAEGRPFNQEKDFSETLQGWLSEDSFLIPMLIDPAQTKIALSRAGTPSYEFFMAKDGFLERSKTMLIETLGCEMLQDLIQNMPDTYWNNETKASLAEKIKNHCDTKFTLELSIDESAILIHAAREEMLELLSTTNIEAVFEIWSEIEKSYSKNLSSLKKLLDLNPRGPWGEPLQESILLQRVRPFLWQLKTLSKNKREAEFALAKKVVNDLYQISAEDFSEAQNRFDQDVLCLKCSTKDLAIAVLIEKAFLLSLQPQDSFKSSFTRENLQELEQILNPNSEGAVGKWNMDVFDYVHHNHLRVKMAAFVSEKRKRDWMLSAARSGLAGMAGFNAIWWKQRFSEVKFSFLREESVYLKHCELNKPASMSAAVIDEATLYKMGAGTLAIPKDANAAFRLGIDAIMKQRKVIAQFEQAIESAFGVKVLAELKYTETIQKILIVGTNQSEELARILNPSLKSWTERLTTLTAMEESLRKVVAALPHEQKALLMREALTQKSTARILKDAKRLYRKEIWQQISSGGLWAKVSGPFKWIRSWTTPILSWRLHRLDLRLGLLASYRGSGFKQKWGVYEGLLPAANNRATFLQKLRGKAGYLGWAANGYALYDIGSTYFERQDPAAKYWAAREKQRAEAKKAGFDSQSRDEALITELKFQQIKSLKAYLASVLDKTTFSLSWKFGTLSVSSPDPVTAKTHFAYVLLTKPSLDVSLSSQLDAVRGGIVLRYQLLSEAGAWQFLDAVKLSNIHEEIIESALVMQNTPDGKAESFMIDGDRGAQLFIQSYDPNKFWTEDLNR